MLSMSSIIIHNIDALWHTAPIRKSFDLSTAVNFSLANLTNEFVTDAVILFSL